MDDQQLEILRLGAHAWNKWRATNPGAAVDLSDLNFESDVHEPKHIYDIPDYFGFDFSGAKLNRAHFRNVLFHDCSFKGADIHFADMCFARFSRCDFAGAELNVTRVGSATFQSCCFDGAELSYCSAEDTDFSGSSFVGTQMDMMSLVKANFSNAKIIGANVFGSSIWNLNLTNCEQDGILVTKDNDHLTVDSIEVAQFMHLLIHNPNIRKVIETITTRVVLILGRFTRRRIAVLRAIKTLLRKHGYIPVLFDFERPDSRDLTETVSTLAHLSRFVIADITAAKSVRQELQAIVPTLPSVPVQPLLAKGQAEYQMLEHIRRYPWVLDTVRYTPEHIPEAVQKAISACESGIRRQPKERVRSRR